MRLNFSLLEDIKKDLGHFQVGAESQGVFTLRFGYWSQIDIDVLNYILPQYLSAVEQIVDEDEDCGILYNYVVTRNKII